MLKATQTKHGMLRLCFVLFVCLFLFFSFVLIYRISQRVVSTASRSDLYEMLKASQIRQMTQYFDNLRMERSEFFLSKTNNLQISKN